MAVVGVTIYDAGESRLGRTGIYVRSHWHAESGSAPNKQGRVGECVLLKVVMDTRLRKMHLAKVVMDTSLDIIRRPSESLGRQ